MSTKSHIELAHVILQQLAMHTVGKEITTASPHLGQKMFLSIIRLSGWHSSNTRDSAGLPQDKELSVMLEAVVVLQLTFSMLLNGNLGCGGDGVEVVVVSSAAASATLCFFPLLVRDRMLSEDTDDSSSAGIPSLFLSFSALGFHLEVMMLSQNLLVLVVAHQCSYQMHGNHIGDPAILSGFWNTFPTNPALSNDSMKHWHKSNPQSVLVCSPSSICLSNYFIS